MHDFKDRKAWRDDEESFAEQLARGRKTQLRVFMRLAPLGVWMRMGALLERNGVASCDPDCQNEGDIEIEGNHLLEIKGRDLSFTCVDDFPYPTIIVCAKRRWTNRIRKPCAFVIVSEITDAALVIPTYTELDWTEETIYDHVRRIDCVVLKAQRELAVSWERLIKHIQTKVHR